jgi:hypothetical protein
MARASRRSHWKASDVSLDQRKSTLSQSWMLDAGRYGKPGKGVVRSYRELRSIGGIGEVLADAEVALGGQNGLVAEVEALAPMTSGGSSLRHPAHATAVPCGSMSSMAVLNPACSLGPRWIYAARG